MKIMWFRRDLRLTDSAALAAVSESDEGVLALYIHHPTAMGGASLTSKHAALVRAQVDQLSSEIEAAGGKLFIFTEPFALVFEKLRNALGPLQVFANTVHEPVLNTVEDQLEEWGKANDTFFSFYEDSPILPPGSVKNGNDEMYQIFTSFYKKWRKEFHPVPILSRPPEFVQPEAVLRLHRPQLQGRRLHLHWDPEAFKAFLGEPIRQYLFQRDKVNQNGTSGLSPWLNTGRVSARTVLQQVKEQLDKESDPERRENIEGFIHQLAWRDFYIHILSRWPHAAGNAYQKHFRYVPWSTDQTLYKRWKEGQTGVPIVDAAMRCLSQTGTMHNRLRMVVASFLVKDLHINWQEGEAWFREQLIDYDLALNNGGWQWAASTGTDAQPYFRIFNPYTQSRKYDPKGDFIRKYVPELAPLTDKGIHAPHEAPMEMVMNGMELDREYPYPIVDHKQQAKASKEMFADAKQRYQLGQR